MHEIYSCNRSFQKQNESVAWQTECLWTEPLHLMNTICIIVIFPCTFFYGFRWYEVDYSVAEKFRFGQDLGCGFLDQSCLTWLKDSSHHSKQPYCQVDVDKANKSRDCTFDRQSVARCLIYRSLTAVDSLFQVQKIHHILDLGIDKFWWSFWEWLPSRIIQYFSDPKVKGATFFSYCPVPIVSVPPL